MVKKLFLVQHLGRATLCSSVLGGNSKYFHEYLAIVYWKLMTPLRQKAPDLGPAPEKQVRDIILGTSVVRWKPLVH